MLPDYVHPCRRGVVLAAGSGCSGCSWAPGCGVPDFQHKGRRGVVNWLQDPLPPWGLSPTHPPRIYSSIYTHFIQKKDLSQHPHTREGGRTGGSGWERGQLDIYWHLLCPTSIPLTYIYLFE